MAQKIKSPFELVRENDYVEYYIFPKFSKEIVNKTPEDMAHIKELLEQLKSDCLQLVDELIKDRQYIWHKDAFQLHVRTGSKEEEKLLLFGGRNKSLSAEEAEAIGAATGTKPKVVPVQKPPHLYGVTHYGDNITDEWFVVFLLKEITKYFPDVVVRVVDADGEFLLIEAAHVLPKWANPYTCEQRVYLHRGHTYLIKNYPSYSRGILTIVEALDLLCTCSRAHRVAAEIEDCIDERLKDFTFQEGEKMILFHNQIVRAPVGVATLLKARPDLIAPAVRAFCERDAIDLKACRSMLHFPPEQRIRTNVRFTRCLYAMLMHSNYMPDRKIGWQLNNNQSDTEEFKEDLLGIKLACGFEILASQAKQLEDNGNSYENSVENSPAWKTYINSLVANGYFRNELAGSQEHQRLLNQAKKYFLETELSSRTMSDVGLEILQLLKTLDINVEALKNDERNLKVSDSDNWLNITPEELDEILMKRYGVKKLYKISGDIDAAEFTNNIDEFLDKESDLECIAKTSNSDITTDDDTENDADIDDDDDADNSGGAMNNRKPISKRISKRLKLKQQQEQRRAQIRKNQSMRRACKKQNNFLDNNSSLDNNVPDGCSGKEESLTEQMRSSLNFTLPEDLWDSYSDSDMDDYGHDDNYEDDDIEENLSPMINALRIEGEEDIDKDIKAYMDEMDKELAKTTIGQTFSDQQRYKQHSPNSNNHHDDHNTDEHDDDDNFDDIEHFKPIDINVNTLKNLMDSYKNQLGGPGPVTHLLNAMGVGMSTAVNNDSDVHHANDDNGDDGASCSVKKDGETNLPESRV